MSLAAMLNTAWMLSCRPEWHAFQRATRSVAQTQADVLRAIIRANQRCALGTEYSFATIGSVSDFQRRVPIMGYDAYRPAIERMAAGEANVLTCEPVELFEPTSGSTGGEKWIPYTRSLRRQFQRGVAAWVADLFHNRSAVRRGRAYWSISPAWGPARYTSGGVSIGFDDDAAYLGRWEQWAVRRVMAAPTGLSKIVDLDRFRYSSLLYLLAAEDLSLISIWNPTFLTTLLAPLEEWADQLCADLRRGLVDRPSPAANPRRAARVAEILRGNGALSGKLREIWPQLTLVSCWGDAASARQLSAVRQLFPEVEIQPKGLLATEGFVSFPLVDQAAPALSLRSHFFEFSEATDAFETSPAPRCRLAHELDRGGRYRVIITTGGGLYRYPLHDEIEVVDFLNGCPLIRFLGKADRTSDLVGEKLSEVHVEGVIDRILAAHSLSSQFAMLAPVEGQRPHYCLFLQCSSLAHKSSWLRRLTDALEQGLSENPHYRYAVRLGQLGPARIQQLDPSAEPAARIYERHCLAGGRRAGAIKPAALDRWTGWADLFATACIQAEAIADRRG
jgi:hypothetical protein